MNACYLSGQHCTASLESGAPMWHSENVQKTFHSLPYQMWESLPGGSRSIGGTDQRQTLSDEHS